MLNITLLILIVELMERALSYPTEQGCGVGVETGVGVGRSGPFWPESESELESLEIRRLRSPAV